MSKLATQGAARIPHPIPYQGSKRQLAARILGHLPAHTEALIEPFAGSAAVTLAAASQRRAARYVLGDSFAPLASLWQQILRCPAQLASSYERLWKAQQGRERDHYDDVRARFNRSHGPGELLFLLARCVKNSVRFNRHGEFNQSPDNRRLGARPDRMRAEILAASQLLAGHAEVEASDYEAILERATRRDIVYLDPPYQGTSTGADTRYHQGLDLPRFVAALAKLRERGVPFVVSFDGRTGNKTHGQALPAELGLRRVELLAGRSTQATLLGRVEQTWESLYLSPELS